MNYVRLWGVVGKVISHGMTLTGMGSGGWHDGFCLVRGGALHAI